MPIPRNFKRWYTVSEAAEMLAKHFNEPVTGQDVVDEINSGDLPVWINATDRYAVSVALACHYYSDITKHLLYDVFKDRPPEEIINYIRSEEPNGRFFYSDLSVEILRGMYRVAMIDTTDYFVAPNGEKEARICFFDGMMVFNNEGDGSLLKIVRRMVGVPEWSFDSVDYMDEHNLPSVEDLRIATSDLFARIESAGDEVSAANGEIAAPLGDKAKVTLLKQIGALAALVAEKDGEYKRGDKLNVKKIADTVGELVDALPDASAHGLKNSSLRQNIGDGLKLLRE
ncbi:hypothetical protein [Burkholderia anthina]|uniref:hypothetical protein n=1 Tax=Burkholderia anthina TaxID=179879 RepID=UPI00158CBF2B|nr:hypothetical protein [Burkholderia anthina]